MFRKMTCVKILLVVSLTMGVSLAQSSLDNGLVGHWSFDADTVDGTIVEDLSGQNDGTIEGDPQLVPGVYNEAMEFDGDGDQIVMEETDAILLDNSDISLFFWFYPVDFESRYMVGTFSGNNGRYYQAFTDEGALRFSVDDDVIKSQVEVNLEPNMWYHIGAVREKGKELRLYVNGELAASILDQTTGSIASDETLRFGNRSAGDRDFNGMLDDVRLYSRLLEQIEMEWIMANSGSQASGPQPGDAATDVSRDTVLAWVPGAFANSHNIYLGTNFDDVDGASVENPHGVAVSIGQSENSYDAGPLQFDQTYFWRVDDVSGAPNFDIYKGKVWQFTVEPVAYSVPVINATASSMQSPEMDPTRTIDGSGLNALDQHETVPSTMWNTSATDTERWIQYEFAEPQKLHEMWVWNSNQTIESLVGFGVKDVTIETSTDGTTWTTLPNVPQFAQATGDPTYTYNTVVNFGNTYARYVRLTIDSGWGTLSQFGLSEVRFFSIPTAARELEPADDTALSDTQVTLSWRNGREAADHEVYLDVDNTMVEASDSSALVASLPAEGGYDSYTAFDLDLSATYFWKIVEVNTAEVPSSVSSPILSFTTPDYLVVDDMESYRNAESFKIWETWQDGYDDPTNGAIVGNENDAETEVVHGGQQSLPLHFDNSDAPNSEATRHFSPPQNWAHSGITTLSIFVREAIENIGGSLYVRINDTTVPLVDKSTYPDGFDPGWVQYNIDLTTLDVSNVRTLTIGVDSIGTKGVIFVDDIRLYASPPIRATLTLIGSVIEAEIGVLTPPFEVFSDRPYASGGQYIMVPNGAGGSTGEPAAPADGWAVYTINIPTDGDYQIAFLGMNQEAGSGSDDSLWLNIPGMIVNDPEHHASGFMRCNGVMNGPDGEMVWDFARDDVSGTTDPVVFTLMAGQHELQISRREDGTGLDAIAIFAVDWE